MTEKNETPEKKVRKSVEDLGCGAYLKMHGYNIVGRRGKFVYFEINESEESEFNKCSFDYVNSVFHTFDANLMSLKKIREYLPE